MFSFLSHFTNARECDASSILYSYDRMEAMRRSCIFVRILLKMCADLALLAIGAWGEAVLLFEDLGQVALVGKSALYCNVSQGHSCLSEQPLGPLNALAQHKVVRAFSRRLAE